MNCVPSSLKGWIGQRAKWRLMDQMILKRVNGLKIRRRSPGDYETFLNSGSVFLRKGIMRRPLSCFYEAPRLRPGHEETYQALGQVYKRMGRFGSAKKMYRLALEIDLGNIEALIRTAHILEREGDYHQAVKVYRKAIEINPQAVALVSNWPNSSTLR